MVFVLDDDSFVFDLECITNPKQHIQLCLVRTRRFTALVSFKNWLDMR